MALPNSAPGAFPRAGPITYLDVSLTDVQHALDGPFPEVSTWYHATYENRIGRIIRQGLIPACWRGGDTCCMFGYDTKLEAELRSPFIIEVTSPALIGELKAWWVPPTKIDGVWLSDRFLSRDQARAEFALRTPQLRDVPGGCACELSDLCSEQITCWRRTWETNPD